MIFLQRRVSLPTLLLAAVVAFGTPALNASAGESVSKSKLTECPSLQLVTREEMVPPYVAVTIDRDNNFTVGATRAVDDSYVVDVEPVLSNDAVQLAEEIESAIGGRDVRVFIYADGGSQTRSFIAVLVAASALELCNLSIVVKQYE